MPEEYSTEELQSLVNRNWTAWQMEASADGSYNPKMVEFYRQRYYYYKTLLDGTP